MKIFLTLGVGDIIALTLIGGSLICILNVIIMIKIATLVQKVRAKRRK